MAMEAIIVNCDIDRDPLSCESLIDCYAVVPSLVANDTFWAFHGLGNPRPSYYMKPFTCFLSVKCNNNINVSL